jgi:hypothetical protein
MNSSDGDGSPLCASVGALSSTGTTLNALLARCGTNSHRNPARLERTAERALVESERPEQRAELDRTKMS